MEKQLGENSSEEFQEEDKLGIKVQQFPVSTRQFPCSVRNRESPATHWNCNANRYQNAAEGAEMAADLKNSLLFSLFSVRHRALAGPTGYETSVAASAAPKVGNPLVRLNFWHDPRKFVSC